MLPEEFDREYERCRALVEEHLHSYFRTEPMSTLAEAMRYSLLAGGKRIRPILVLQFAKAAGGDMEAALPAACAVEMLHTYSLIHDDLPCMDNDDLRRGKAANHIVFGKGIATLAGDALQAEAFATLLNSRLPDGTVVAMARALAKAAGLEGICLGQALDMAGEGVRLTLDQLTAVHHAKTASLLVASAQLGVLAAGGSDNQLQAAEKYARHLGFAFQVRDDILDYTSSAEVMGKRAGSDSARDKTTFMTLMSLHDARRVVGEQTQRAVEALKNHFENTEFLVALAIKMEERKC